MSVANGIAVLVVDDDAAVRAVLIALLTQDGMAAHGEPSAAAALSYLAQHHVDVVLSDLRMPDMDGMALLKQIRRNDPELPVVMLTAHGTVSLAVEAMQAGAADFLLKPFDRDNVKLTLEKAAALAAKADTRVPQRSPRPSQAAPSGSTLLGDAAVMRALHDVLERAAQAHVTVLLTGETGTGKELAARAIHDNSARAPKPFVAVSCAALPETLLESELFGHEKGAFTGAVSARPGRFELADGGTLFLDEIGEVPLSMQAKLLRVLQERETQRIGAIQPRRVDVRVIAATHRNLEAMVAQGAFREDLYYRLNVLPITLPPLRDRGDDSVRLAEHFCDVFAREHQRPRPRLDASACAVLLRHAWPGNVRQLQNVIERLVVMGDASRPIHEQLSAFLARDVRDPRVAPSADEIGDTTAPLAETLRHAERQALIDALRSADNNRSLAARLLGISRRNLYQRLHEHGL